MRYPNLSQEEQKRLLSLKSKRISYVSFFPVDPLGCECHGDIRDIKQQLSNMSAKEQSAFKRKMKLYNCPKKGGKLYGIYCKTCKFRVATLRADNKNLENYHNFHYEYYAIQDDNTYWRGAFGVNTRGKLGIECACGVDERQGIKNGFRVKEIKDAPLRFMSYGGN